MSIYLYFTLGILTGISIFGIANTSYKLHKLSSSYRNPAKFMLELLHNAFQIKLNNKYIAYSKRNKELSIILYSGALVLTMFVQKINNSKLLVVKLSHTSDDRPTDTEQIAIDKLVEILKHGNLNHVESPKDLHDRVNLIVKDITSCINKNNML